MKVFLVTWGLFCVLVIVGLFIAYATDNFPGVPAHQQVELETGSVPIPEDECSPCEENLKRLKEALERWEREHEAAVAVSEPSPESTKADVADDEQPSDDAP